MKSFIKRRDLLMLFRNNRRNFYKNAQLQMQQLQINEQYVLLSLDVDENIKLLRSMYKNCFDVTFRTFLINGQIKAVLVYIEGLSSVEEVECYVLAPLMAETANGIHSPRELLEKKYMFQK